MDAAVLVLAFASIIVGAELFTNGIEWFGRKLELAEGAVGSVLAAVGTALPETMVPIVAILFAGGASQSASNRIGVGAILGAPFMLSTLAMFVTGVVVLIAGRSRPKGDTLTVDREVLVHDVRTFVVAYALAIATAFLPADLAPPRWVVALVLLGTYAWYVKGHFDADPDVKPGDLAPLRFQRFDRGVNPSNPGVPALRIVNVQVIAALGLIVIGAFLFVNVVEHIAKDIGVDEAILALIVAPIATELPEAINAIIWVRQGKETLAMGNITGAMVFQATIPTVVALLFASSSWAIAPGDRPAFASAAVAFLACALIFGPLWRSGRLRGRGLLIGGVLYVGYVAFLVAATIGERTGA
jgi:cation:H+ antiporter